MIRSSSYFDEIKSIHVWYSTKYRFVSKVTLPSVPTCVVPNSLRLRNSRSTSSEKCISPYTSWLPSLLPCPSTTPHSPRLWWQKNAPKKSSLSSTDVVASTSTTSPLSPTYTTITEDILTGESRKQKKSKTPQPPWKHHLRRRSRLLTQWQAHHPHNQPHRLLCEGTMRHCTLPQNATTSSCVPVKDSSA